MSVEREPSDPGEQSASLAHWNSLDGLRGIACFSVLCYHFMPFGGDVRGKLANLFVTGCHIGWVGVDLFFALSGFLITGILLRVRQNRAGLTSFYVRRLLRIAPLYYLVLFATLVVLPHGAPPAYLQASRDTLDHQSWLWLYGYNARVFFTGQFWADEGLRLSHFWSLAVEEHFYFVWPFLVLRFEPKRLLQIALGVALLEPCARALALAHGTSHAVIYCFSPYRLDALLLGSFVALAQPDAAKAQQLRRFAPLAFVLGACSFLGCLAYNRSPSGLQSSTQVLGFSGLAVAAAALVVIAVQPRSPLVGRALGFAPLRWLGKYSYGAYVLHQILQPALDAWVPPERVARLFHSEIAGLSGHIALGFALTFALAVPTYHLFEEPLLQLKRRFGYAPRLRLENPLVLPART